MTWTASFPLDKADREFGDAIAFIDDQRQYTYRELRLAVAEQGGRWRQQGLRPQHRVAFIPRWDFATLCTFWTLFANHAVACPISPRFPVASRKEIATQLGASWLPDLRVKDDNVSSSEDLSASGDLPATIILTSGSAGQPKAVVHSLAAHIASAEGAAANTPLRVGDRWLWSLPSYHVSGLAVLIRCALAGATVVTLDEKSTLSAARLESRDITHLSLVDTQLQRLLHNEEQFPSRRLKMVLLGGSAAPWSLIAAARQRGVPIHTTYGLTEMASQVTTTAASDINSRLRTAGRVLPHRELMISDDQEILVRGKTLCLGYYRAGQVTPVVNDHGWFATGDLGQLDEAGYLTVTGRRDNMFISGGENIHPEIIERALLEIPEVRRTVVVPREDSVFGARPVAVVDATAWDSEAWESTLREKLAGYQVPDAFLPWPTKMDIANGGIKPNRARLAQLVRDAGSS